MIWFFSDRFWSEMNEEMYSQVREFLGTEEQVARKAELNEQAIYFFADLIGPDEEVEQSCVHQWEKILKLELDYGLTDGALILCGSCSELRIVKDYDYDDVRVSWGGKKV